MNKKKVVLSLTYIFLVTLVFIYIRAQEQILNIDVNISHYLSLGYLVIAAHFGGLIAKEIGLPSLTGNIVVGAVLGPYLTGLITLGDVSALGFVNSLALSFIAITAGGELKMESLKRNLSAIVNITVAHIVIILPVISGFLFLLIHFTPLVRSDAVSHTLVIALLLGTIAVAKSPASTIAIINEYKAKGTFTDVVLGVTMLKDVVVLLLFAFSMAISSGILEGTSFSVSFLFELIGHLVISGVAGVFYGILMILFFKYVAREISIFIVLASFLSHDIAAVIGLEHMFMCMVAGFVVQNYSAQGSVMIESIENSHLPIYVVFFALAGAGLNFGYFSELWLFIIIYAVSRILVIYGATYGGAVLGKSTETVKKYAWTGFVTNAGLTLSMVIVIENEFSDIGPLIKSVVISLIAINQVLGPVLFKFGIHKSGESTVQKP